LAEGGEFCFYHCPYTDENGGYMCGEESPSITDIDKCPIFQEKINTALGGTHVYIFYTKFENGNIAETICQLGEDPYTWILPSKHL